MDMIWWCEDCLETESVTNQKQIFNGKYKSDGEETFVQIMQGVGKTIPDLFYVLPRCS
jgi:hypothetical protein